MFTACHCPLLMTKKEVLIKREEKSRVLINCALAYALSVLFLPSGTCFANLNVLLDGGP